MFTKRKKSSSHRKRFTKRKALVGIIFGLIGGFLIRLFLYKWVVFPFQVNDHAMSNLPKGKTVLVWRFPSKSSFKRDMLVLIHHPNARDYTAIRRVSGLPGDTIQIKEGKLYINKQMKQSCCGGKFQPVSERKPILQNWMGSQKVQLGSNEVFLITDKAQEGADSTILGPISTDHIEGYIHIR